MAFNFARPSSGGGSSFVKDEHIDHPLVFVEPTEEETTSAQYGPSLAARCSFVVCLLDETVSADVLLWGTALVPALCDSGEELIIGRLGRGEAKMGRSAAWLLFDPSESDLVAAEEYFTKHATRYPSSGKISLEVTKPGRREPEPERRLPRDWPARAPEPSNEPF